MEPVTTTVLNNDLFNYSNAETYVKKDTLSAVNNLFFLRQGDKLWALKMNYPCSIPCEIYYPNRTETYTHNSNHNNHDFDDLYIKLQPNRRFKLNINIKSIKKGAFKFVEN